MNYVKQFLKGGIFLVVCAMVFGFSNNIVFALSPNDKCGPDNKGTCKIDHCDGDKNIGECEGYPYGNLFCCVPEGSDTPPQEDYQCDQAGGGTCKPTVGSNKGCGDNEIPNGQCRSNGVSTTQTCCKVKGSPISGSGSSAALNYTPLENLPGFEGEIGDFATYFKNLYLLALWIVGISALFMLVVGGFLYLSSAGNTSLVGTAKKTIYGALIGLVIALISWLLLDTINSDLTNLKLSGLSGAVGGAGSTNGGGGGGSTGGDGKIPEEYRGKGSGCSGAETQGAKTHCEDASQDLSDALLCLVERLKKKNKTIEISSISDDLNGQSIFKRCRDSYDKSVCEHGSNSCHYGGSKKMSGSCAADLSGKYINVGGDHASVGDITDVAPTCGFWVNNEMSKPNAAHIHVSVRGCGCN